MARKHEAGYVSDELCLLCDGKGTLLHRHFFCEGADRVPMPSEFRVLTDRAGEPAVRLLLERGLWEGTKAPTDWRPPCESQIVWHRHD
eukprot:1949025-Pyramimonas_sp.AAC.1